MAQTQATVCDPTPPPRRGHRIAALLSSDDAVERKRGAAALQEAVRAKGCRCSIVWLQYLEVVARGKGALPPAMCKAALDAAGCDPLAYPLWNFVISSLRESADAATDPTIKRQTNDFVKTLFQRGLAVPLAGHQHGNMLSQYEAFLRAASGSGSTASEPPERSSVALRHALAREMWALTQWLWPERFAYFATEEEAGAASHLQLYFTLLQVSFAHQLRPVTELPVALFNQRVSTIFEIMLASHPRSVAAWLQYACFAAAAVGADAAQQILARAKSALPDVSLLSAVAARIAAGSGPGASPAELERLVSEVPEGIARLSLRAALGMMDKKALRAIGKTAVQERRADWQLYDLWAQLEALPRRDAAFAGEVWDRCLELVDFRDPHERGFMTMRASDFFSARGDEAKLKNCVERALQQCSPLGAASGVLRDTQNRQQRERDRFGGTHFQQPERPGGGGADEASSLMLSYIRRYSYGGCLPCSERDLLVAIEAQELLEAAQPPTDAASRLAWRNVALAPQPRCATAAPACVEEESEGSASDAEHDGGRATAAARRWVPLVLGTRRPADVAALQLAGGADGEPAAGAAGGDLEALDRVVGPLSMDGAMHARMEVSETTRQRLARDALRRSMADSGPTAGAAAAAAAAVAAAGGGGPALAGELQRVLRVTAEAKDRAGQGGQRQSVAYERVNPRWLLGALKLRSLDMKTALARFVERRSRRRDQQF